MRKLRYLLPLALITGMLALPAGTSANANLSTISFAGNATLLSVPGPVNVTLHYSCPSPNPGELAAEVIQNNVPGVSDPQPANCDGQNHTVTLTIPGAFVPGSAEALAVVRNASASDSGTAFADQKITLK